MKLTVVGSSSRGNCYILQNDQEALIIEAGCAVSNVQKALGYNISKVAACIVSHEHKDHSEHVSALQKYGIKCYMSEGTSKGVDKTLTAPNIIRHGEQFVAGAFTILPFSTHHDCNEPLGFLISHEEIGTLLFAIDTCYLAYTFNGLTNIMIECNYSEDILEENIKSGKIHPVVRKHVIKSHMSLQTCLQALQANNLSKVNNIILMHLSKSNGDAKRFKNEVELATGKSVHIAEKNLTINIDKTPF